MVHSASSTPATDTGKASTKGSDLQKERKQSPFTVDFQVFDANGEVEVFQKPDGKVYVPGKVVPLGQLKQSMFFNWLIQLAD